MDDTLPQSSTAGCSRFLGYQPVLDAVRPDSTGVYPPTNVFAMPFLEKAWAKYLDAYPEFRGTSTADAGLVGYSGTKSTPAHYAMAALTGGAPHRADRLRGDNNIKPYIPYQGYMLGFAHACVSMKRPCVISTPSVDDLGILGDVNEYSSVWLGPAEDRSGLISPLGTDPKNPSLVVFDFHNTFEKDGKTRSTTNVLVGNHAYTVDPTRSFWDPDLKKGRVTLLNPWGCNPVYGDNNNDGYCEYSLNRPRDVTISLSLFINLCRTIYYVDELPAVD